MMMTNSPAIPAMALSPEASSESSDAPPTIAENSSVANGTVGMITAETVINIAKSVHISKRTRLWACGANSSIGTAQTSALTTVPAA